MSDHNLAFFEDNGESNDGDGSHGRDIDEHRGELQSIDLILLLDLSSTSFTFPFMMKSFKRLTSDNFTGFNRKSSAPSSRHLTISINELLRKHAHKYSLPNRSTYTLILNIAGCRI